jgi:hypothetical protein
MQDHHTIAAVAEEFSAIACGVTRGDVRGQSLRAPRVLLARQMFAAMIKDLGLTWPQATRAASTLRKRPQSEATLRDQRNTFLGLIEHRLPIAVASALAVAIRTVYERAIAGARLRLGEGIV